MKKKESSDGKVLHWNCYCRITPARQAEPLLWIYRSPHHFLKAQNEANPSWCSKSIILRGRRWELWWKDGRRWLSQWRREPGHHVLLLDRADTPPWHSVSTKPCFWVKNWEFWASLLPNYRKGKRWTFAPGLCSVPCHTCLWLNMKPWTHQGHTKILGKNWANSRWKL